MKKSDYNILVVDDDNSMKELMQRAIESLGYKVTAVSSPDEAIKAVRLKTIHFAIVDVMLSKMNGVELAVALRKSGLSDAPLILVSGIFTDSSFAKDAISKSGAIKFFPKPFNLDEITGLIDSSLKTNDVSEKVSIQTLLSKKDLSTRDRIRVVDQMEEVNGLDMIFVLNIFLESKLSGHLNIIDSNENIYGVSFCEGSLYKVDSDASSDFCWDYLKSSKYFFKELKDYHEKFISSDLLGELVEKSMISPHVMQLAHKYQILKDLDNIYKLASVKINFSPLELKKSNFGYSINEVEAQWLKVLEKDNSAYFKNFYQSLKSYSLVEGDNFSDVSKNYSQEDANFIKNLINNSTKVNSILLENMNKFGLVHYLAIKNIISFENFESSDQMRDFSIKKLSNTYIQLKNLDPYEIFKYFGSSASVLPTEVSTLYKEFAKLNHPDKFSDVSKEEADIVHNLFSLVTNAHNQLTNTDKRIELENSLAQKSVEKQMKSEALSDQGLKLIRTGKYKDGIKLIEEAIANYSSEKTELYWCWGIFKLSFKYKVSDVLLTKANKIVNEYPASDRRTALYQHILGLSALSDNTKKIAFECFKKALILDSRFMDSRREIAKLSKPKDDSNLFTGDITTVFSKIFKK